jgi:uncharacterized membrane protein
LNRLVQRFGADRGGATTIIVGLMLTVLLFMVALAVDVGSIFLQSRRLQGMADLAALAAARDLPRAQAAAQAAVTANDWSAPMTVAVSTGVYSAQKSLDPTVRFTAGAASPNAARVVLTSRADLTFARILIGQDYLPISRSATAARADLTSFSIGSRLAGLQGGVANALLSGLTGGSVSLSVSDYNALAQADVSLFDYADALRTHLSMTGASYDKVLSSEVTTPEALGVLAQLMDDHGQDTGAAAIRKIAAAANATMPAELGKLVDLGPYGDQDHVAGGKGAGVQFNALDLTNAMLTVSQGGRQVKLDLGASIPGLTSATVWLGIGERAETSSWLKVDDTGEAMVETTQTRLYIDAKVLPVGSVLNLAGLASVHVPLLVELASAKAKLSSADCTTDLASRSATLSVQPSIGHASIADIDTAKINDFSHSLSEQPAALISLLKLVTISGQARTDIGGADWQAVRFSQAEITAATIKTVNTNDIVQSVMSSLLGKLQIDVQVGPLGLLLNKTALASAATTTVSQAAAPLDGVLDSMMDLLGVHLGQADVRVNGLRCKDAALVA